MSRPNPEPNQTMSPPEIVASPPLPADSRSSEAKPRGQLWSRVLLVLCLVVATAAYPCVGPIRMALAGPVERARIAADRIRLAEQDVAAQLDQIERKLRTADVDTFSRAVETADEFQAVANGLRLIGEWLLQEKPRILADLRTYVAALKDAVPDFESAAEHYAELGGQYPEGSDFRDHYSILAKDCEATARSLKDRAVAMESRRRQLDKDLDYVEQAILFINRLDVYFEVVSVEDSEESRRISDYLQTLTTFQAEFKRMTVMLSLVRDDVNQTTVDDQLDRSDDAVE